MKFLVKILFSCEPRNLKGLSKLTPFGLYELVRERLGRDFERMSLVKLLKCFGHSYSRELSALIPRNPNHLEHFYLYDVQP